MSSASSKQNGTVTAVSDDGTSNTVHEDEEEIAETASTNAVTSHVYIKPPHSSQTLDKDVVLRRIRLRKRVNRVRSSLQRLFASGSTPAAPPVKKKNNDVTLPPKRWIDDAFAAP